MLWFGIWYHCRVASGQTRIRMPTELHAKLISEADRQHVSLNTLMVALLAGGIGFKLPAV